MSKPKPKIEKVCPVCGRKFLTARARQNTCGAKCHEEYHKAQQREKCARDGRADRKPSAHRFRREYVPTEKFKMMMAEIWAPPRDDEPISNYIGHGSTRRCA